VRFPFTRPKHKDRQRKAVERATKRAMRGSKMLTLIPPEGVPLDLKLASIGQRFGAQLLDFAITLVSAICLISLLAYASGGSGPFLQGTAALILFLIRVPYYIVTELIWNGRTLAKRWLGMRVVSVDGRSLTPHQIVVRNIMKEVEFFAPLTYVLVGGTIHWSLTLIAIIWTIILLFVPWRSKLRQRVGDVIANTAVILDPKPVLLRDLVATGLNGAAASNMRFAFTTEQLDHYGKLELQVLEKVLRAPARTTGSSRQKHAQYLADIVARITHKIAYPEHIPVSQHSDFLNAFYSAQRAHLENRKLFGDAREDKFFRETEGM